MLNIVHVDDYQQLAPGEEKDLNVTMSRYECAISNIEAFTEKLSRDLSSLDGVSKLLQSLLLYGDISLADVLTYSCIYLYIYFHMQTSTFFYFLQILKL